MYAYFKGILDTIFEDSIIVEVQDIGYHIFFTSARAGVLPAIGEEVKVYTYTCVREDAFLLYGFLTKSDLEMFKMCINVNGIGPKAAMSLLSIMDADSLRMSILSEDTKSISKAPGIGAKTASRLVLELKDKIDPTEALAQLSAPTEMRGNALTVENLSIKEAQEALVALGYSAVDALKAIKKVENYSELDVEMLLKSALKYIF